MKVYIAAAKRTAVGSFLGSLKSVPAAQLGAEVIKNIIAENNINAEKIDEVITGNVLSAGLGQCIGRQAAVLAGVPHKIPSYIINMVCGSGMKSVMSAYISVKSGGNLIIAGGTESMSRAPFLLPASIRCGNKAGDMTMTDSVIFDALTDAYSGVHMGITAENIAEKYNISREEQDGFAYSSQLKAISAVDGGSFKDEIVPLNVTDGKNEFVFDTDEYPNRGTNPEKLANLRAAFKKDGTVTAGNASGINDGASYVLVASENAIKEHNLTPLVEIIGIGQAGVDPQFMGLGPVGAIKNVLESCGKQLKDMDILELNEAFAAQSLGVIKLLSDQHKLSKEEILYKTNKNGGAIALGHPVGASGNRIIVTLIHQMLRNKYQYGLASLCIGGGMGTALILKRI